MKYNFLLLYPEKKSFSHDYFNLNTDQKLKTMPYNHVLLSQHGIETEVAKKHILLIS